MTENIENLVLEAVAQPTHYKEAMKLLHYSKEPFQLDLNKEYITNHWKPKGLWISVDNDWAAWCESENYCLERMKCVSEVTLKPDSNVFLIDTLEKLDAFNTRFELYDDCLINFSWDKVKSLYDGVIIAPYFWQRRFNFDWYSRWVCASGIIWNLSSIDNVILPKIKIN
jgi:hypothetical protein